MIRMESTGAKNEKKSSLTIQHDGPGKYSGAKSCHGNWTQQTSINEKGKPTKIVKRTILYKD
jgi:hypothetical protein